MTLPFLHAEAVQSARERISSTDERTLTEQAELAAIPAPSFAEEARGLRMAELMAQSGLVRVRSDEVGNILAERPGTEDGPPLVVSAHLDTVFPADTPISISRQGDLFRGPGISDDARGLAVVLAMARALEKGQIRTRSPLLFVATVCEEGVGDLRGVKHLFRTGGEGSAAKGFISVDGAGTDRLVVRGLGSRRFRLTLRGPGGHSWTDWGKPNPIHGLSRVVDHITRMGLATDPRTTLTVARWGGGTSINAIPQEAWIEVDTRSESPGELDALDREIRSALQEHARGAAGPLSFEIESIGSRPGGSTAGNDPLVSAAMAATRALGREPVLSVSSTDANIPMSLGIPAITVGGGGEAGETHTTNEWYRNTNGSDGVTRALYLVLLAAGY